MTLRCLATHCWTNSRLLRARFNFSGRFYARVEIDLWNIVVSGGNTETASGKTDTVRVEVVRDIH
jgi:hypothetical protein